MKNVTLCVVAVLLTASFAGAATVWNPAGNAIHQPNAGNWSDPGNWTNDIPGVNDNKAVFNVADAAECFVSDAQTVGDLVQGDNADGGIIRIQNGGTLTTTGGWAGIGYNSTAQVIVETGGVMNFGGHSWIGFKAGAEGTVDVNGGLVNVAGMFGLGWDGGNGYVNVNNGGILALSNIHGDGSTSIKQDSLLSINGTGIVTLPGDFIGVIDNYAASGLIAGNGVLGNVEAIFADGVTTVSAVPEPATMAMLGLGALALLRRKK